MKAVKLLAPLIPYIAVAIGVYGAHSMWLAFGLYHAGILSYMLFVGEKSSVKAHKSKFTWHYPACIDPDGHTLAGRLHDFGLTRHIWPYFAVYFCLVNAVLEELFWRGSLGCDQRGIHPNDLFSPATTPLSSSLSQIRSGRCRCSPPALLAPGCGGCCARSAGA